MWARLRAHPVATLAVGFLLGVVLGLAQAPTSYWWVVFFVFPACVYWLDTRRSWLMGYALGVGYFGLSLRWITEPFAIEADVFGWLAPFAWAAMAAGLALFWLPVFALPRRAGGRGLVLIAGVFTLVELARGWLFTGFPWGLVSYGFVDTSIAQLAVFTGSYLLSGLVVLVGLLVFNPWLNRELVLKGSALAVALLAVAISMPDPENEENADFRVMLVQANIPQTERHNPARAIEFLDLNLSLSWGGWEADLIIWPESAVNYIASQVPDLGAYMRRELGNSTPLIFGATHVEGENYFNSAYLLEGEAFSWRYDKRQLVPFGEYIPLGGFLDRYGLLPTTLTRFSMSAGTDIPAWDVASLPEPVVLICYEGIFPRLARAPGAMIIQITNDSWFGTDAGPQQHLSAMRMRAIETGKPVLRATTTGISAIIGADGAIRAEIPLDQTGTVIGAIGASREFTIYGFTGDIPTFIFAIFAILWGWPRDSRRRSV